FSSRRRHTSSKRDWSSDVCSSDLIMIVVGFKLEQIMEAAPDAAYVYNEAYDQTNTSKSLLKALRASAGRGTLWLNGDVVFHPQEIGRASCRESVRSAEGSRTWIGS